MHNIQYSQVSSQQKIKEHTGESWRKYINEHIIVKIILTIFFIIVLKYILYFLQQDQVKILVRQQITSQLKEIQEEEITTWEQLIQYSSIIFPALAEDLYEYKIRARQGINKNIQVGTNFDYLNITDTKQFQLFRNNFERLAPHKVFTFEFDQNLEKPAKQIEISFKNIKQVKDFLQSSIPYSLPSFYRDIQTYLGINLNWNFNHSKVQQAQYFFTNSKYKYNDIYTQVPICLISTGYKVYTKDKYKRFFESIERQNYSNYQVVVVDDFSPDNSAERFYQYLASTNFKLKNRIKIIKTLQRMGALANMYIGVKKYCPQSSVVVNVDSDDALIGAQTFNILNAIYQNPNTWYVYTRYLWQKNEKQAPDPIISRQFYFSVSKYRQYTDWLSSHLRTYRQKLMDNVPVEHFIEYKYDENTGKITPYFHESSADRFQAYSHLELSGDQRVKYITDMLYFYERGQSSNQGCYRELELFEQYKSKVKDPLQPLASLEQNASFTRQPIPVSTQIGLEKYFNALQNCKKVKKIK